ncbi:MAG: hypothetical protein R3E57_02965 [Porticoccaceae bacterium]
MLKRSLKATALFPVTIYRGCQRLANRVSGKQASAHYKKAAGLILYFFGGLPLTIFLSLELLILANARLMADPVESSPPHQEMATGHPEQLELPGHRPRLAGQAIVHTDGARRELLFRQLLETYSPTIIQKIGHQPLWDIPTDIFFDGDTDPRNNVDNARSRGTVPSVVYGEVIAETVDSYYLAYMLYHVRDYDLPLREALSDWTYHDSDNEGLQLRIDKTTMKVALVETWFHNRFFLCNNSGESNGTEPIQSPALFEDGSHIIIHTQAMGHGVRCAEKDDFDNLASHTKILRLNNGRGDGEKLAVDEGSQFNLGYRLASLKPWYELARNFHPSGKGKLSLFEDTLVIGTDSLGQEVRIGRYIAGKDFDRRGWSRPKPPWSWDDRWDDIPVGTWHLDPALAFSSHTGEKLSGNYLYNAPASMLLNQGRDVANYGIHGTLKKTGNGGNLARRPPAQKSAPDSGLSRLNLQMKRYVNHLINSLG